jgi:predicted nucleic acid-binding protein
MMVLADTSIWIDHFRQGDRQLIQFLNRDDVVMHPFVIGELALGSASKKMASMIGDLGDLPQAIVAMPDEVLKFIVDRKLSGCGIGYVDAHLLASVALVPETLIWTRDKRLQVVAKSLSLSAKIQP